MSDFQIHYYFSNFITKRGLFTPTVKSAKKKKPASDTKLVDAIFHILTIAIKHRIWF